MSSIACRDRYLLCLLCGFGASLLFDGLLRMRGIEDFNPKDFLRILLPDNKRFFDSIVRRVLFLNALGPEFQELVSSQASLFHVEDLSTEGVGVSAFLRGDAGATELNRSVDNRRKIESEIDVLMCLSLGINHDEFASVFKTYFPVQHFDYDIPGGFDRLSYMENSFSFLGSRDW